MENIQIVRRICALLDELAPVSQNASAKSAGIEKYEDLITYVKDRPGHDRRYAIDCSRSERECGWVPSETFETGIRKTVQWYLDNVDWCRDIAEKKYARERLGNA